MPRLPAAAGPAVPLPPAGARARAALHVLPPAQRHAAAVRAAPARLPAHLRPAAGRRRRRLGALPGARLYLMPLTLDLKAVHRYFSI